MSATVKGQQGMVFRGVTRRYVPGQGDSTVFVYESGILSEAQNFYSSQRAVGTNAVDLDESGPPYRVEVATPDAGTNDPDTFEDQWEITDVDVTKSIFELDSFRALSTAEQTALQGFAADTGQDYDALLDQLTSANAVDFSLLILRGTTEIQAPTAGLRWTRIVSRNYSAISSAYNSVNRIFSLGTIQSFASIPASISDAVAAAQGNVPSAASGYATGWLKKQPSVTYRGAGRIEITQQWTLENWSTFLYGSLV
jgi:hypothetical protein